jgi:hypothetical protein
LASIAKEADVRREVMGQEPSGGTCCINLHRINSSLKIEAAGCYETLITNYHITRRQSKPPQLLSPRIAYRPNAQIHIFTSKMFYISTGLILKIRRDSSVRIATAYGLDYRGSIPRRGEIFFSSPHRPDRHWGPPSLLYNGYRGLFPGG